MTAVRPDKLRKVEALRANAAATDGEKAAADAAANRIRARSTHQGPERNGGSDQGNPGVMYLLGRAWGRRRHEASGASTQDNPGIMRLLGRAWRRAVSKW